MFIEHSKACGSACFGVLEKYRVSYSINKVQENERGYYILFFSNSQIWPDEQNFGEYIL